jgi:hypothetical protein
MTAPKHAQGTMRPAAGLSQLHHTESKNPPVERGSSRAEPCGLAAFASQAETDKKVTNKTVRLVTDESCCFTLERRKGR